jgi:phage shock protein E
MIDKIKKLLGIEPPPDYKALMKQGAQIIDVRTRGEYSDGHIRGSINIPLDRLPDNLSKIKKDKPVITCCASGMRSASAKGILKSKGFKEVYNGGGWMRLESKLD